MMSNILGERSKQRKTCNKGEPPSKSYTQRMNVTCDDEGCSTGRNTLSGDAAHTTTRIDGNAWGIVGGA